MYVDAVRAMAATQQLVNFCAAIISQRGQLQINGAARGGPAFYTAPQEE
jgi:hypothetical protein